MFWGAAFGAYSSRFTRLQVHSDSYQKYGNQNDALKKLFWNSDTCIELYFCVEFKSKVLRHKKIIEFSWIFLVVVEYRMTKTANAQNWCEPNSDIDLSQNSKHTTYLKF